METEDITDITVKKRGKILETNEIALSVYFNSNAKGIVFIVARFIANNHAFLQRSHISISKANTLRALVNI